MKISPSNSFECDTPNLTGMLSVKGAGNTKCGVNVCSVSGYPVNSLGYSALFIVSCTVLHTSNNKKVLTMLW